MKRFLFLLSTALLVMSCVAPCIGAVTYDQAYYVKQRGYVGAGNFNDPLYNFWGEVQGYLGASGTGDTFYVDSNVSVEGDGTSWANAKNTLDEAINLCTASNGDVIEVAQGHAENLAAADAVDADIAGITIKGVGNGLNMPTFNYTAAGGEFVIGAAGVKIQGLRFVSGVTAVTMGISVEAAGDYFTMTNCEFVNPGTATYEFYDMVDLASGADYATIVGNRFHSTVTTTGCNEAIDASAGVVARLCVAGNDFQGAFAVAPIFSDQVNTDMLIIDNTIKQATATQFCIEFTAAATGIIANNRCNSATVDYEVDPGSALAWNNDEGTQMPEGTSLYDLVGTLRDAAAGTGVYPTGITDDSIIAMLLSKSGTASASSYSNTTDSLEALADHIQTLITTAAGADVYPSGITSDSIIAMILSKAGTAAASSYNNTTDSLEALSDQVSKIDGVTLATAPTAASLASFIASGGVALGTQLATSKSLVDALGTNGTTVADTATGVAGMVGVNDADNAMDTSSVAANPYGSVYERQAYTQALQEIQMATGLRSVQGTGMTLALWYVNGGVVSGNGLKPSTAFGTLAEALAVCSNTVDDWILVMDYSGGGTTIVLTDAFCHIIGFNSSRGMPYPRFKPASAVPAFEFKNASDRVELANLVIGGGDQTKAAIVADAEASAGAYGCWIHDCVIGRDADAPANDGIEIQSGADMPYLVVENCTFYGVAMSGCDQSGIEIAGNCTGGSILNCFFQDIGSSTNPAINLSGTVGNMRIQGNRIAGTDDGAAGWGITLSANCTNIFVDDTHSASSDAAGDASAYLDSAADEANAWGANYTDITLDLP